MSYTLRFWTLKAVTATDSDKPRQKFTSTQRFRPRFNSTPGRSRLAAARQQISATPQTSAASRRCASFSV